MNNKVVTLAFSIFFTFMATCSHSQDMDLIVTSKADSIVCHIDSVTNTHIYFRMKSDKRWINTYLPRSKVLEFNYNIIHKREYSYRPGTSIIDSSSASIHDVPKNSLYLGMFSINYGRKFPLGKSVGLALGGGFINIDGWGVILESSMLFGDSRHFFEPGIMGAYFFAPNKVPDEPDSGDEWSVVTVRTGYRYQGRGGLLLRGALNIIFDSEDVFLFPALSIGFSF